jgi:hypothetical protein
MKVGIAKTLLALAPGFVVAAPLAIASPEPGATTSVWTVHGRAASAAGPALNVLTISDQRGIDNRISVYFGPTGRLVLSAPEGLGDPDGSGTSCSLDNAGPGQQTAQQVSCEPGYIGAIVGDLGGGSDVFAADPGLGIYIGAVVDGQRRPMAGGPGRDRIVGGAASDLLDGGSGQDTIVGGAGGDVLVGGPGADKLVGKAGTDTLNGLAGPDRLNGGPGRDLCRGGAGQDRAKHCEVTRTIP